MASLYVEIDGSASYTLLLKILKNVVSHIQRRTRWSLFWYTLMWSHLFFAEWNKIIHNQFWNNQSWENYDCNIQIGWEINDIQKLAKTSFCDIDIVMFHGAITFYLHQTGTLFVQNTVQFWESCMWLEDTVISYIKNKL